ncbi:cellulose binding domain-containing protein, partial [Cellulomonas shaoxiangyii]
GGTGGGGGGAGGQPTRAPAPPPPAPSPGVVAPPSAVPAGACTARYELVTSWPGGYQAQVTVTATTSGVTGWLVQWPAVPGLGINDRWGADIGTSGGTVSAENLSWNGTVADRQSVVFGFTGTADDGAAATIPQLRCTRTR